MPTRTMVIRSSTWSLSGELCEVFEQKLVAPGSSRSIPGNEPRITTRNGDVVRVFAARQIARFTARDKYIAFVVDGVEHLLEEALASLEERLAPWGVVRVHRAALVQSAKIRAVRARELELDTGEVVPVSRRMMSTVRRQRNSSFHEHVTSHAPVAGERAHAGVEKGESR